MVLTIELRAKVRARVKVVVSVMNTQEVTLRDMVHRVLARLIHLLNRKRSCLGLKSVSVEGEGEGEGESDGECDGNPRDHGAGESHGTLVGRPA